MLPSPASTDLPLYDGVGYPTLPYSVSVGGNSRGVLPRSMLTV